VKVDTAYLRHILDAIRQIEDYMEAGRASFLSDRKTQDAVIRNLEIIGEATKNLSEGFRRANPSLPWKQIAGMRDVLIHHYFGVDLHTVLRVIEDHLPRLRVTVETALAGG
jgi:uncharacterized protein with HEPN domain